MADEEMMAELIGLLRGGKATGRLNAPELKDARNNLLATLDELGLDLTPGGFLAKAAPIVDAIEDLGLKAGIIESLPEQDVHCNRDVVPGGPWSGLSPKDALILVLVALMLWHGGDSSQPTALGEAVESNNLQVIAIIIALAAYLRKRE